MSTATIEALGPELAAAGVRLEVEGDRATVSLTRADRLNAQTPATWQALAAVASVLPGTVRAVVLRAEGRAFSAGLDRALFTGGGPDGLPSLGALPAEQAAARIADFQRAFSWWRRPDLVSVAAVQGHAIGAGFQLALACDLRVLARDAQLTMAETGLGLVPDLGGTGNLVDLVGYPRALEICGTGRRIGAEEAARLGLAELVVDRDELDAATDDLVAALLAAPRDALIETKALLAGAAGRSEGERLAAEREAQVRRLRALAGRPE